MGGSGYTFVLDVSDRGMRCTIDRFDTKTIDRIDDGISTNCNIADSLATVNGDGNPVS